MSILDRLKKGNTEKAKPEVVEKSAAKSVVKTEEKPVKTSTSKVVVNSAKLRKNILLKPVITEKASMSGTYQFMVTSDANRVEIAKAFAALYNKVPRKVNIISVRGKSVRFGRLQGKRASWKKAIVYLKKGETIDLYA